jgi:hypothetical protein
MRRNFLSWRRCIGVSFCLFLFMTFLFFHFFFASLIKKKLITIFRDELHAELQLTVWQEGFLFPKLIFRDVMIHPLEHEKWHCKIFDIECSFTIFRLLTYWNIPLIVTVKGLNCVSAVEDQTIIFLDFCQTIFRLAPDFFKPTLQALLMSDCKTTLFDPKLDIQGSCSFNGNSISMTPDSFELHGAILLGTVGCTKRLDFVSDLTGVVDGVFDKNTYKVTIQMKGIFTDAAEPFMFRGHYADNAGRFSLSTAYPYCFIDPIIYTKQTSKLSAKCSLAFLQHILQMPGFFDGIMNVQLQKETYKNQSLQGLLTLENGTLFDLPIIASLKMNIAEKQIAFSGPIITKTAFGNFEGNYTFDLATLSGQASLQQKGSMNIDYLTSRHLFDNTNGKLHCLFNKDEMCIIASGELIHKLQQEKTCWKLTNNLIFSDGMLVKGVLGSQEGYGLLLWKDLVHGQWDILDNTQSVFSGIFDEAQPEQYHIESQCKGTFMKQWLQPYVDQYGIKTTATVSLSGDYVKKQATIDYTFFDGVCDIPSLSNGIIKARGNALVDFTKKEIVIPYFEALCTKGFLSSHNAHMYFNDTFCLESYTIPLSCTACGVSLYNVFDVVLSAHLLYHKKKEEKACRLSGEVTLHQGILKNDTSFVSGMNDTIKDSLFEKHTIIQNLHITSESPLRVDTEQLYTDVMLDITTSGTLFQPHMNGYIECVQGEILFPYKPLPISRGKLIFSGGTLQDAALELLAKDVVKNYAITMHAVGFLRDYTLLFDATPYLSQSQIFSLLLFGSDQESVSVFAPSLFSHNIKLGSFDIRFIPGFSDKSGRGGIRGALEIAVNKRLRAMIQKNFTLSEDTRFELEYTLTDAVTLRGIRDERRDVGGEIEFRWKF